MWGKVNHSKKGMICEKISHVMLQYGVMKYTITILLIDNAEIRGKLSIESPRSDESQVTWKYTYMSWKYFRKHQVDLRW